MVNTNNYLDKSTVTAATTTTTTLAGAQHKPQLITDKHPETVFNNSIKTSGNVPPASRCYMHENKTSGVCVCVWKTHTH